MRATHLPPKQIPGYCPVLEKVASTPQCVSAVARIEKALTRWRAEKFYDPGERVVNARTRWRGRVYPLARILIGA